MRLSYAEIISGLERYGLKFTRVSVFTEGKYTPEDAIWSYKDAILHISHIHPQVRNVPIISHEDSLANVFLQTVFGLKFPLIDVGYEEGPYTQTAIACLFFYVLIIRSVCEEVRPGVTRITTTYNIGANRFFSLFSPIVGWALKRNYKILASADIPLRERRGELRLWGYDFLLSDYVSVENMSKRNVIITPRVAVPPAEEIAVPTDLDEGASITWGRTDHFGIRLLRSQGSIFIYPRLCPHQGAVLDTASCRDNHLDCPWHGLRSKPLATIDLSRQEPQEFNAEHHRFNYSRGRLLITPLPPVTSTTPK